MRGLSHYTRMPNPIRMLTQRIRRSNKVTVARELGVSPSYLGDVMSERRDPGKSILDGLGLQRVVSYRWKDSAGRVPPDDIQ